MKRVLKYKFEIIFSLLVLFIAFSPYVQPDLIVGSDHPFHLARIETLTQNMKYGCFPAKLRVDLAYGYGYGVGFFYPDFFLYIPAFLKYIGLSLEVSFKLFAGLIMLGIYFSMFYSAYRLTRNRFVALSSAAVYLLGNYVLNSFYYAFTLGTSLGLIFLPLAICGMYLFMKEDASPFMLGAGFTGLLLSHVLSTVLAFLTCLLIFFCCIKSMASIRKFFRLLLTVLAVMGITACFWLPMFEQFASQSFRVSEPWTYVDNNVVNMVSLLNSQGPGWFLILFSVGVCLLRLLIPSFKKKIGNEKFNLFYWIGMIFLFLPVCSPFWKVFRNVFKFLQFPVRLISVATVLLAFAFGIACVSIPMKEKMRQYLTVAVFLLAVYWGVGFVSGSLGNREDFGNRVLYQEIAGIGAGEEWLPLHTTREDLTTPTMAFSDRKEQVEGERQNQFFKFNASKGTEYYDIPLVWYKGYKAAADNGQEVEVIQNPENGLARVRTDVLQSDTSITVYYAGTPLLKCSYAISVCTVVLLIGIAIWKKKMKKGEGKKENEKKPVVTMV